MMVQMPDLHFPDVISYDPSVMQIIVHAIVENVTKECTASDGITNRKVVGKDDEEEFVKGAHEDGEECRRHH